MEMALYCIHCGATIPPTGRFCPKCGAAQAGVAGPSAAPRSDKTAADGVRQSAIGAAPRSKVPILVLVLILAIALAAAFVVLGQSKVSDAASLWCTDHDRAVVAAGRQLGIFPPNNFALTVDGVKVPVQGLSATGLETAMAAADSVVSDWLATDADGFARSCNGAFNAK